MVVILVATVTAAGLAGLLFLHWLGRAQRPAGASLLALLALALAVPLLLAAAVIGAPIAAIRSIFRRRRHPLP